MTETPERGGRRAAPTPPRHAVRRRTRRGLLVIAAVAIVATGVILVAYLRGIGAPSAVAETAPTTGTTSPAAHEDPAPSATGPAIAQSAPTRLIQPDVGLDVVVRELPADHSDPINPPTLGEAYWDPHPVPPLTPETQYGLGSSTPDLTVIAAHTSNEYPEAAFNPLYDWQSQRLTIQLGQEVWVQTQASGSSWLVYTLTKVHFPSKGTGADGLANSAEIWGTQSSPRPNHLLLIGCQQQAVVGVKSTNNIVWDFTISRVSATAPPG